MFCVSLAVCMLVCKRSNLFMFLCFLCLFAFVRSSTCFTVLRKYDCAYHVTVCVCACVVCVSGNTKLCTCVRVSLWMPPPRSRDCVYVCVYVFVCTYVSQFVYEFSLGEILLIEFARFTRDCVSMCRIVSVWVSLSLCSSFCFCIYVCLFLGMQYMCVVCVCVCV